MIKKYLDNDENRIQPTTEIKENITEKSGEQSKYQSIRKSIVESVVKSVIYSDEESISVSIFEPAELSSIEVPTDIQLNYSFINIKKINIHYKK